MKNRIYIGENQIKLFMTEQDDFILKNKKWSHYLQLYLKEQLKRSFQDEDSLRSNQKFALLVVSRRLLNVPEELEQLKASVAEWDSQATVVYLFQEQVDQPDFNGYYVPLYTIDPESNLVFSYQEIFEQGKMQYFLARISDVLYTLVGILLSQQELTSEAVYLACCDDSLNTLKQLIRKEILQNGYFVYPEKIYNDELVQQLGQALLSIHLFGKNPESKIAKEGDYYSRLENKAAVQIARERLQKVKINPANKALKRIIWIPETGSIRNEKQEAFIEELKKNPELNAHADFYWGSTELLKEAVMEAIQQQSVSRALNSSQNQVQQMVARKEKATFKYSDNKTFTETRYTENPGDPDSNAKTHQQPEALHHNMMHWLRPTEEFRPNPLSENPIQAHETIAEKKEPALQTSEEILENTTETLPEKVQIVLPSDKADEKQDEILEESSFEIEIQSSITSEETPDFEN